MMIGAHALALQCVLVTDNVEEFRRIEGLEIENWRQPLKDIFDREPPSARK